MKMTIPTPPLAWAVLIAEPSLLLVDKVLNFITVGIAARTRPVSLIIYTAPLRT